MGKVIFPIGFFSFNEAENISPLLSAYTTDAQNLNDSLWPNVWMSGNILPETLSEAQQSASADISASPT